MLRVAVDAMGGDHAPAEVIKGALGAVDRKDDLQVFLVGSEEIIRKNIGHKPISPRVKVIHAEEVITNDEEPGLAVFSKRKSSLITAMQMVRRGEADAVLSAGNTGALMGGGLIFLERIGGIRRPALLTIIPILKGEGTVLLDIGANMDAKPEHLLHYALMGQIYAREVLGKKQPRVSLLNVGSEKNKGNAQVKSAYKLMRENVPYFMGNLEATDIFRGKTDVLVCDGFTGNVLLKTIEGLSGDLFAFLDQEIKKDLKARDAQSAFRPVMQKIQAVLDESEYGGSLLIGVKGACFKCHGSSREKAIRQAILKQVYPFVSRNTNQKIEEALRQSSAGMR
ncbi:MAG: phosphate acyltransferase PlsX [Firmicutes bacterium]|nr:phosphate acyltransferase PlsX [Bacillota bacterium]